MTRDLPSGSITFLFTDIEGSTKLLHELGSSSYAEALREHRRVLREAFLRHDGVEVDTQGDAFFVAFPTARGALEAADEAQMELMSGPVRVRVGIHTGTAHVTEEGYVGVDVHKGARIAAAGHGGQVLVSESTSAFVEAELLRDLGEHRFKDLAAPERIYQLGDRDFPPLRAREVKRGIFVGREGELAELLAGLEDAFAGQGRLFLVAGEPGIGKSSIADELIANARAQGAFTVVGRCWEAGGAPAFWPWIEVLRGYVQECDPDLLRRRVDANAAELAQLLPELRELLPDVVTDRPALESEEARFRLFEAVAEFLASAASDEPLVVVLDDLHAADEPSLLLLRYVVRDIGRRGLVVVCLYRDVDPMPSDVLQATLAELVRVAHVCQLTLARLTETEVRDYVERAGGGHPPPVLAHAIHSSTEGNPLFVAEAIRLLDAEGRLDDADARLNIPLGARATIAQRIGRLSEPCRDVLVRASVLGREFELDALAQLSGLRRDELLDVVDEAVIERVVGETPGHFGRLRFDHVLIRDVLYEGLSPIQRAQLHRLAGEALEAVYPADLDAHLADLARHFVAAAPTGEEAKAIAYSRRAGDRAAAQFAYEEAVRLYETVLPIASDELERGELLVALGDAQTAAGDEAAGVESLLTAADVARRLGSPELLARSALRCGGRFVWSRAGGDPRVVALIRDALEAVGTADSAERARLLVRHSMVLRGRLSWDEQDALTQEAVDTAERVGDPTTLAHALQCRRQSVWRPEGVDDDIATCHQMVQLADSAGDWEHSTEARLSRSHAYLISGNVDAARADLDEATRLASDRHVPSVLWHIAVHQIELALLEGRFTDTESLLASSLELGERAERKEALDAYASQSFALRRQIGGAEELASELARMSTERPGRPLARCLLAELDLAAARPGPARTVLSELVADDCRAVPRDMGWMLTLSILAGLAFELGDSDAAATLYSQLLPAAELVVIDPHEFCVGAAARYLGLLALTAGRIGEAYDHIRAALDLNARIGARPWVAHTQVDYCRLLRGRGEPGDAEQADRLLGDAMTTYRELGMPPWLQASEALL